MGELDLIIPPEKEAGIVAFVTEQITEVKALEVTDAMSLANGADVGQKIKGAIKRLEEMRKEFVNPLNAKVKEVNNKFHFFSDPLEEANRQLNEKMVAFQRAEMEKARLVRLELERKQAQDLEKIEQERRLAQHRLDEEQKKIDEGNLPIDKESFIQERVATEQQRLKEIEAMKAQQEMAVSMVEPVAKTTRTASGAKVTFKESWKWEITDSHKIPKEYLCVDERTVKEAIAEGVREIDGIRIFKDISVSR